MLENQMNLLKALLKNDIIDPDVLDLLNMKKKKMLQEVHPFIVTPPKNETGRRMTYIKSEEDERIQDFIAVLKNRILHSRFWALKNLETLEYQEPRSLY